MDQPPPGTLVAAEQLPELSVPAGAREVEQGLDPSRLPGLARAAAPPGQTPVGEEEEQLAKTQVRDLVEGSLDIPGRYRSLVRVGRRGKGGYRIGGFGRGCPGWGCFGTRRRGSGARAERQQWGQGALQGEAQLFEQPVAKQGRPPGTSQIAQVELQMLDAQGPIGAHRSIEEVLDLVGWVSQQGGDLLLELVGPVFRGQLQVHDLALDRVAAGHDRGPELISLRASTTSLQLGGGASGLRSSASQVR